jgi:putative copper export protein
MVALEAIVGGFAYAILAFLAGLLIAAGFLLPAAEGRLRGNLVILALGLLLSFLVAACLALLLQGAKLRGGTAPSPEIIFRYLTLTQAGKVWLAREAYGVALALTMIWLVRRQAPLKGVRVLGLLALPLLASRSFTSHAVAVREDTLFVVSADALHLIATGLWGGGVAALGWILYRGVKQSALPLSSAAETVRRFSLLALFSVAVLVITGLYQSWIQVGSLPTLFTTDYGLVLIVKLVLFLGMVSLGALNWLSTKARLIRSAQDKIKEPPVVRSALTRIGAESALGLLIFFVTGLLTVLPPGVHAVHQAARAKTAAAETSDSATAPQLQAAEGAGVKILEPMSGQVFGSDKVPLRFNLTKGKRGDHVHAYIDGELMGMFQSKQGTLNGLKPGRHVLELRVVAEDHQTELDAQDRVEFVVK